MSVAISRPEVEAHAVVAPALVADWQFGYPELRQILSTYAAIEVTSISEVQDRPIVSGGVAMRAASQHLLSAALSVPGLDGLELRYRARPQGDGTALVQMTLIAKALGSGSPALTSVANCLIAAGLALPSEFQVAPISNVVDRLALPKWASIRELQRPEHVSIPQWDFVPSDYYYYQDLLGGDGSGWPAVFKTLSRVPTETIVSLLFQPTTLHPVERDALGSVLTQLAILGRDRTDYNLLGNADFYPADENARLAHESWAQRLTQIEDFAVVSRVAVAGASDTVDAVAAQLAAAIAQGQPGGRRGRHFISSFGDSDAGSLYHEALESMAALPTDSMAMWTMDGAPTTLRRTQYLLGLDEASSVGVLPVADDLGAAGFHRGRRMDSHRGPAAPVLEIGPSIGIGTYIHEGHARGEARLPVSAINRHVLVVGTPGSGKTTTVQNLLLQLWHRHRIPFLVIEPSKSEYRALIELPEFEDLKVITLGNESIAPLRMNPLSPPPGVRCEVHMSRVLASLRAAMPLFAPIPQILAQAIPAAYYRAGWDDDSKVEDGHPAPTLRDLLSSFREVFDTLGYEGEARNICRAFEARIGGLLAGSKGRMLDTVGVSDIDNLLRFPTIIEMDDIEDSEEKAILSVFLLNAVRSQARRLGNSGGRLRHVTVIEEAHRLLAAGDVGRSAGGDASDVRAEAVGALVDAIAELRSSGEGFVLASQQPLQLAPAAVANTGTRIIHRLDSGANRESVLDDLGASVDIRSISVTLRQGEALVRWAEMDHPEFIKIVPEPAIDTSQQLPDDELAARMYRYRLETQLLLPYRLCSLSVCAEGCDVAVRRSGQSVGEKHRQAAKVEQSYAEAGPPEAGARRLLTLLSVECGRNVQATYCAAVHLGRAGAAFLPRPGVDDRGKLERLTKEACDVGRA